MPIVKYLKHEIHVDMGSASRGETAFVVVDGERICFLGGEEEARRFLRERKLGQHSGPRPASWFIELDSGCTSHRSTWAGALDESEYWKREGRAHKVVRVEHCRHPGCDGHGGISERLRSGWHRVRPCPMHEDPVTMVELEWQPGGTP